jgi:hypothetical protein
MFVKSTQPPTSTGHKNIFDWDRTDQNITHDFGGKEQLGVQLVPIENER